MAFVNDINQPTREFDQKKPKALRVVALALILLVLAAIFTLIYFRQRVTAPFNKDESAQQIFTVAPGAHAAQIGSDLYKNGLISNALVFELYSKFRGDAAKIEAGTYVVAPSMSMQDILDELVTGKTKNTIVEARLIEGWTIDDMGSYLEQNHIMAKQDFLNAAQTAAQSYGYFGETVTPKSLEGYLFPDTYFLAVPATPQALIQKMLNNLDSKISSQMRADIATQHLSMHSILIVASIVEREVGRNTQTLSVADEQTLAHERKIVAEIFYKRLAAGMPLQSDATVAFLTKRNSQYTTSADRAIDSPYNTYKYPGLPPGPISNPSLSSIEAAIYPEQTDYLYFLTKPDGTAVFAKTAAEQSANVQKYLR